MDQTELCFLPATSLAQLVPTHEVSPIDVVDAVLARIDAVNPRLTAYCTITADEARTAAREAEARLVRGEATGPLHGVSVSTKSQICTHTGCR
jgi:aspartyl-tRNA(Asn)/glutamyl-tRNA(Gln) amidotransferase subunit A